MMLETLKIPIDALLNRSRRWAFCLAVVLSLITVIASPAKAEQYFWQGLCNDGHTPLDGIWDCNANWGDATVGHPAAGFPDDVGDVAFVNHPLVQWQLPDVDFTLYLNGDRQLNGFGSFQQLGSLNLDPHDQIGANTLTFVGANPIMNFFLPGNPQYVNCNLSWAGELRILNAADLRIRGSFNGAGDLMIEGSTPDDAVVEISGSNGSWAGDVHLDDVANVRVGDVENERVGGNDSLSNFQTVIIDAGGLLMVDEEEAWGGLSGDGEMSINGTFAGVGYNEESHSFSGIISGAGRFEKGGAGTLTLSGINTYTGGTKLLGGLISISADNNLGEAAAAVTFDGGGLAFTSTYVTTRNFILDGSGTIVTPADHEVSGNISGAGGLTKTGIAVLTITGNNTYSGETTLQAGTLAIDSDSDLGSSSGITFIGGTLKPTTTHATNRSISIAASTGGGTIEVPAGLTYTIDSSLTGSGQLTKTGDGTLELTADNTGYTGNIALNAGTLQVDAAGNLSGSTNVIAVPGTTFAVQDGQLAANVSGGGALVKTGASTLTLSSPKSYTGGTTISAGRLNTDAENLPNDQPIVNNSELFFTQAGFGTFTGDITGSGDITQQGQSLDLKFSQISCNTLKVTSFNTLLRNVLLNANEIRAVGPGGLTLANGVDATANAATTEGLDGRIVVAEIDNIPGALVVNGDTVVTDHAQLDVAFGGTITTNNLFCGVDTADTFVFVTEGGTLTVTNQMVVNQPGNQMRVDGTLTAGQFDVSAGTPLFLSDINGNTALTVGTNNGDSVVDAIIANSIHGPGSITKVGTGTLEISDPGNTYSGGTTVDGGTLLVTGSTGSGMVTVNNGATLGGDGTIPGSAVINGGGGIAPGASAGMLSTGDLTFSGDAEYLWELDEFEGDTVFSSGTIAFDGASPYTVRLFDLGGTPDKLTDYVLFDAVSVTGFNAANWSIDYGTTDWSGGVISQDGNLVVMTGLAQPGGVDANITDVQSLLVHGAGPGIELAIDLDDTNGIEPRVGGPQKLTFEMSEAMDAATVLPINVQINCAVQPPPAMDDVTLEGVNIVAVDLVDGLTDKDCCTFTFDGMETDTGGVVIDAYNVTALEGDTNFSGTITGGDLSIIKLHFGEIAGVNLNAPQWDFDRNGGVTGGDFAVIKPLLGRIAPACP